MVGGLWVYMAAQQRAVIKEPRMCRCALVYVYVCMVILAGGVCMMTLVRLGQSAQCKSQWHWHSFHSLTLHLRPVKAAAALFLLAERCFEV
jgi:hypothetical protein